MIFVYSGPNRREEELFADLVEYSKPLQLILHRVFEFGKAQSCPGLAERFLQL